MQNPFTFTYPVDKIKAALVIAAKSDLRYYLNGVYFQRFKDGVVAVATDGHRMIALYSTSEKGEAAPEEFEVIVPRESLELMLKASPRVYSVAVFKVEPQEGDKPARITFPVVGLTCDAIEGKYPDWQRIVPAQGGKEELLPADLGISAEYLGDYAKVCKALGRRAAPAISLIKSGEYNAIRVDIGDPDVVSVVMPIPLHALPRRMVFRTREAGIRAGGSMNPTPKIVRTGSRNHFAFLTIDGYAVTVLKEHAPMIEALPELLVAAEDVIADLQLFVSKQGPGPDRRLAALIVAIAKARGKA